MGCQEWHLDIIHPLYDLEQLTQLGQAHNHSMKTNLKTNLKVITPYKIMGVCTWMRDNHELVVTRAISDNE